MITKKNERYKYIDALRALCIFLVIYNHTQNKGYDLYAYSPESPFYFLYLVYSIFDKIAVPCFLTISGMLLLRKQESIKDSVLRTIKFICILIFFSFFMQLYNVKWDIGKVNVVTFLTTLYSKNHATAYWYLYAYIALLLSLPILRLITSNIKAKHINYLVVLYSLHAIIKIFEWTLFSDKYLLNYHLELKILDSLLLFPIIGYFLENIIEISKITKGQLILYNVISIICIVLCAVLTTIKCQKDNLWNEGTEKFFQLLILFPVASVILDFKMANWKGVKFSILGFVGRASFCTFLLEKPCRDYAYPLYELTEPYIGSFLAANLWAVGGVLIGTTVYIVYRCCRLGLQKSLMLLRKQKVS